MLSRAKCRAGQEDIYNSCGDADILATMSRLKPEQEKASVWTLDQLLIS